MDLVKYMPNNVLFIFVHICILTVRYARIKPYFKIIFSIFSRHSIYAGFYSLLCVEKCDVSC